MFRSLSTHVRCRSSSAAVDPSNRTALRPTSDAVLYFSVPSSQFLLNAPQERHYRVVCTGAATRSVTDTDLSVVIAPRQS